MNMESKPMAQPQAEDEPYAVEIAVNQAIGACDGDLRATIRALIIANNLIEHELEHVIDFWCSSGFARGKLKSVTCVKDAIFWWFQHVRIFALDPPRGIRSKFTIGVTAYEGE